MKGLLTAILLGAIVYVHQGVYVCTPNKDDMIKKQDVLEEKAWRKYRFDKQCDLQLEIKRLETMAKVYGASA